MDWKSFFYGLMSAAVVLLALASFGLAHIGSLEASNGNDSENMPEKCRPPAERDIASWKEHLGHHAETKECLKYFS